MKRSGIFSVFAILAGAFILFSFSSCNARKVSLSITVPETTQTNFLDKLQKKFPDVDFKINVYRGEDFEEDTINALVDGKSTDIISTMYLPIFIQKEYLYDLSGYEFMGQYKSSIINQFDIDGSIYLIPGMVSYRSMAYNQTLFEEHGWPIPKNHAELLALCKRIRRETDITPIGIATGIPDTAFSMLSTFAQCGFLSTPDGLIWGQKYFSGDASFEKGFSGGINIVSSLIEAGAFDYDQSTGMSEDEAIQNIFAKGKCAMFFVYTGQKAIVEVDETSEYVLGLLPFYGENKGENLIGLNTGTDFGINKRLSEKGSEKKLHAALKIFEWISSMDGRRALRDSSSEASPLDSYDNKIMSALYSYFREKNQNTKLVFMLYSNYEDVHSGVGELVFDAIKTGNTAGLKKNIVQKADELHFASLNK